MNVVPPSVLIAATNDVRPLDESYGLEHVIGERTSACSEGVWDMLGKVPVVAVVRWEGGGFLELSTRGGGR